jgi:hypothetical protein
MPQELHPSIHLFSFFLLFSLLFCLYS